MADIRPFRGVRYNQKLITDISCVLCPPYDVISPQQQQSLYLRSDYNIIRLECGRELPEDASASDKYSRAATIFHDWLQQGVLQIDEKPALYLHDHYFTQEGRQRQRRSLLACVGLEPWHSGIIRPHENTSAQPKSDRLKLLTACQAQFSPIFALYDDRQQEIASILATEALREPCLRAKDGNSESHVVWCVTESELLRRVGELFSTRNLYIADGHHRYETALAYQQEMGAATRKTSPKQPYDFTMMTLVATDDPGLAVLPQHRLIKGLPPSTLTGLKARLGKQFSLQSIPLNMSDPTVHLKQLRDEMQKRGEEATILGVWGLEVGHFCLLTPANSSIAAALPRQHSEAYKKLDVSLLEHLIIEGMLNLEHRQAEEAGNLVYTQDAASALMDGLSQRFQLVFFLNPLPVQKVQAVADSGDRMPRKSTYFYPKPPTGLVCYKLEPGLIA